MWWYSVLYYHVEIRWCKQADQIKRCGITQVGYDHNNITIIKCIPMYILYIVYNRYSIIYCSSCVMRMRCVYYNIIVYTIYSNENLLSNRFVLMGLYSDGSVLLYFVLIRWSYRYVYKNRYNNIYTNIILYGIHYRRLWYLYSIYVDFRWLFNRSAQI